MTWLLDGPAEFETVVRNSVFRVRAAPVSDEDEALAFLAAVADPDATHNCWAFRIGERFRSSDDGEPGGTAGRPILAAIDGQDCDEVMVVVTRRFGGVKLGTGGLVRAYGGAAASCLRNAAKRLKVETVSLRFHCPFALYAAVEARLPRLGGRVAQSEFDAEGAALEVMVPLEEAGGFESWLGDLSRGRISVTRD